MNDNQSTFSRFWSISKLFFVSEERWKALGLLGLLASFSLIVGLINEQISQISADFTTALQLQQRDEFVIQLMKYLGAFLIATPIVVFYRFTEERFGLYWRRWLSLRLLSLYFSNRSYYKINILNLIDNPDQRLEEDIRSFTAQSLSFFLIGLNSVVSLVVFVKILWGLSSLLPLVALVCAFLGSLCSYLLGAPLIHLNFAQLKKEADYRYKLVNIRDNAESIAFYGSEGREFTRSRQRLKAVVNNLKKIIARNRNLSFFTQLYNYVIPLVPMVVVAPLYFNNQIQFGKIIQAQGAFLQVLNALSIVVLHFQGLSSFAAVINRLSSFLNVVNQAPSHSEDKITNYVRDTKGPLLSFSNVEILPPQGSQKVVTGLSFSLNEGEGLLIIGKSGAGKSSILRAAAGLWVRGKGEITRPDLHEAIFLPQRPYLILGTLRSQFLYGVQRHTYTDKELRVVIDEVGLSAMVERVGGLETELDWPSILSAGEQQRIGLARLLLKRPRLAFLDEATTALDREGEARLYGLLRQRVGGLVSVGHESTLAKYHDKVLSLTGESSWEIHQ